MAAALTAAGLRSQFRWAHRLLTDSNNRSVAGREAQYAGCLVCEDVIVNGVLDAGTPLALSAWRNRTGLSELPPLLAPTGRHAWTERVLIDPVALRCYARAVQLATDAYLARQPDQPPGELTARVLNGLLLKLSKCSDVV